MSVSSVLLALLTVFILGFLLGALWVWLHRHRRQLFRFPERFNESALAKELGVRLVGTPANGARQPPDESDAPGEVIWIDNGDDALVHLNSMQTRIIDRLLLVSVELETDQTGRRPLVVALALGGDDDPAGLVAVTDELPHGDPILAARWGRTLQAAVWASLLGLAGDHATERNLTPLGISAVKGSLRLHAGDPLQAR